MDDRTVQIALCTTVIKIIVESERIRRDSLSPAQLDTAPNLPSLCLSTDWFDIYST
jgi:hypothetical protein